ncbi:hypothetical protein ACOMHN_053288 [Nucella lapillus]
MVLESKAGDSEAGGCAGVRSQGGVGVRRRKVVLQSEANSRTAIVVEEVRGCWSQKLCWSKKPVVVLEQEAWRGVGLQKPVAV